MTRPTERSPRFWVGETFAGLSGAIGSVPDGLATAVLAGANPMAGLYASLIAPIVGGALTSTSVMVIATTSAAAVTTSTLLIDGPTDPIRTLATLTVLAGLFMLIATALGAARLMRFVSASVMGGFLFGIGLILILGQLADAAGVEASGSTVIERAWNTVSQIGSFDIPSVLTAVAAIAFTLALSRGAIVGLAPLVGIAAPMVVLAITGAQVATVATVGAVQTGLPSLVLPDPSLVNAPMVATALALTVVVLVQSAGVAAAYPNDGSAPNRITRDFTAQGAANVASGVIGGIPVGGSVGQTAVNVLAGGRSRWAAIISGVWMLVFLLALGPLLGHVPIPALAGLLILAGVQALRPKRIGRSWRTSKSSAAAAIITLVATLVAPITVAVLIGVLLSLLLIGINGASRVRVLGLERTPQGWRRIDRPRNVAVDGITVVDVEGASAFTAVERVFHLLPKPPDEPRGKGVLVIRMRAYLTSNLTFALALERYARTLDETGVAVILCGLGPRAFDQLSSAELPEGTRLLQQGELLDASLNEAYDLAQAIITPR